MNKDKVYFITEYKGNQYLDHFENETNYFSNLHNFFAFVRKLSIGLKAIHDKGFVHADLRPGNILVDENNDPVIVNFESSVTNGKKELPRGTYNYVSPEVFRHFEDGSYVVFHSENDLYSMGIIMYELIKKRMPFRIFSEKYSEMMSRGIYFSKQTNWQVFHLISGLIRPLSSRISEMEMIEIIEQNWISLNPEKLRTNIKYKLADFANSQELEVDLNDIIPYLWVSFGIFIGLVLVLLFVFYYIKSMRSIYSDNQQYTSQSSHFNESKDSIGSLNIKNYGSKVFAIKSI
jgi:serine/threonine protein kinase